MSKKKEPQDKLKNEETQPVHEIPPVPEQDVQEAEAPETEAKAEPKSEREILVEKFNELNDRNLRLMAEYDNFRKRSQKERDEIYPTATATAVCKFLPVLDNLERANAFPHSDDDFGKGFDLIFQSFQEVLEGMDVHPIGEVGEAFDPDYHNAVMHIEDDSLGENVVSQVLQKGYRIGDKVIRYAMVQTAN